MKNLCAGKAIVKQSSYGVSATAKKALVYFGGNAEDVALNIPDFKHYFPDHTLYLVNYRGFGGSTGKPTESGIN